MKPISGLKLFFTTIALTMMTVTGFSQQSLVLKSEKTKKFTLISPLDLKFKTTNAPASHIMTQRSVFDADKLPLFCKIEHKLSKNSNLNIRMRLGSLDYVNKLEGKN